MGLLDLLFPKNCLECKRAGKYICSECLSKVVKAKLMCPICKRWSIDGKTHSFCSKKFSLDGHYSFYKYEGIIRKAILALKYRFASSLAEEIVNILNISGLKIANAIIVPVPLHKKRENWRGFNQSAVLGKMLAEKNNWEYKDNLVLRLENTMPQAKLSKEERLRNISGKFAVNEDALNVILSVAEGSRQTFVIFDDVWTTGATIGEIAKELKKAGAKEVWGMSVARG